MYFQLVKTPLISDHFLAMPMNAFIFKALMVGTIVIDHLRAPFKSCGGLLRVACRTGLGVIFVNLFRRARASARRTVESQTRATEGIEARNSC